MVSSGYRAELLAAHGSDSVEDPARYAEDKSAIQKEMFFQGASWSVILYGLIKIFLLFVLRVRKENECAYVSY